jgi:recombination protein RecT
MQRKDMTVIDRKVTAEIKHNLITSSFNYSVENALKSAWFVLKDVTNKSNQPAIECCTKESIFEALMNMAVQGLNPIKKQCYFVIYDNKLQCIRSYMGSQMVAKLVDPSIKDIRAQIVYEGDEFEMSIKDGQEAVTKHTRNLKGIISSKIIGAYAIAVSKDNEHLYSDVMTIDEIKTSWKQSKWRRKGHEVIENGNINPDSVHGKFTNQMAKRTIINRLCKHIINTSNDSALLLSAEMTEETAVSEDIEISQDDIKDISCSGPSQKPRLLEIEDSQPNVYPEDEEAMPDGPAWATD